MGYQRDLRRSKKKAGVNVEIIWCSQPTFLFGKTFHGYFQLPIHVIKKAKNFDIIHASQPQFTTAFRFIRKVKKVVTFFDLIPVLHAKDRGHSLPVRYFNFLIFLSWIYTSRYADTIVAISSLTKQELLKFGISEERIRVINLWVREGIRRVSVRKDKTILGYLGAITHRKDVKYIVEAFGSYQKYDPNSELWLCGKGDQYYIDEVRELADKLGIADKVKFKGFIPEEDVPKIYSMFDVFLFGTRSEGFGLTILEAQKCLTPVIIRAEASIPEEVKKFCLKATSPEDMAEKAYALVKNKKLREAVVRNGAKYAKKFTLDTAIRKLINVYEELL